MPGDNSKQFNKSEHTSENLERIKKSADEFKALLDGLKKENENVHYESQEHSNATDLYIFNAGSVASVMFTLDQIWLKVQGEREDIKYKYHDIKLVEGKIEKFCK